MTLDPTARDLIQRSRRALRPSEADRRRIDAAMVDRLGTDVLGVDKTSGMQLSSSLAWKLGLAVCLGVIGSITFLTVESKPNDPAPLAAAPTQPPQALKPEPEAEPEPEQTPAAAPANVSASPAPPHRDMLAREVALLSAATTALRAGDVSAALRSLDEHKRKYPNGVLREERRTAQAQALCSIGRVSEGRAQLKGLPPTSPTAARAAQVCQAAATSHASQP